MDHNTEQRESTLEALLAQLAKRQGEIETDLTGRMAARQTLNAEVRTLRAEKAQIERLLRAAAGRKPKKT